nr:immunoglobulin light chain junction region [Mus musculus]
CQQNNDDPPTF